MSHGPTTRAARLQVLAIAVLAYVPLLLNDPGRVVADTKAYLYLDPGRLLERATSMWHPEVGLGSVTHQNIGFLWPIGPFYWVADVVGLPDWLAQRLWMGSILLAAGLGVRWLLRTLGWQGPALLVAALAYMLSPYLLNFLQWVSPILLPWAALPWLLGLADRALRTVGWRHAGAFGLVTLTVGGVNATSLLLVGLGPVAWLAWCGLERSVPWRRVLGAATRIGVAVAATGLWWVAGLAVQSRHGLPTLHLTENYRVVSDAATAPELFRGLGYWYFYGQGHLGPWIESATSYTRWALPLSFGLPLLGLAAAALVRFRHRGHVLCLLVVGLLVGIGAHPYDDPSFLGGLFRDLTLTDAGLALRSTARVLPLVVLATAILLGAGVAALGRWRPRLEVPVAALACLLVVANLSPAWTGTLLSGLYQRPEDVPAPWTDAARHLDAGGLDVGGHATRVLVVPGSDFAAYRWGHTGDPVLPGLMDRPHVARELIPQGSPASAELLVALDREIQEDRLDPDGLAPLARLLGVGDVVVRSDLQYERYRTPRPADLWARLVEAPGFDAPVAFGDPVPNVAGPERPLVDAHTLSRPDDRPDPPPVAVLPVLDPQPIVRLADPDRPIVVVGDAAGIVAAAGEGLLVPGRPVLFSATLTEAAGPGGPAIGAGALVVLTDTNREQGRRWGTIRETHGYTERADEDHDPTNLADQPLRPLPGHPGTRTVALQTGLRVEASGYGNPVTYTAGDRPFHAVDGRDDTAWLVGGFSDVRGEWLELGLDEPRPVEAVTVLQVGGRMGGPDQDRWITRLAVHADAGATVHELDEASRTAPGQVLQLPGEPTSVLRLEVLATDVGPRDHYIGLDAVGFAEVVVPGVAADETILLPTDLVDAAPVDHGAELAVVLTRERVEPRDPDRRDPEVALDRTFVLPWARTLALRGEARLSAHAADAIWDRATDPEGVRATASGSLRGDLGSRPRSAFDGDASTAWQSPIDDSQGAWLEVDLGSPRPLDGLHLVSRADGLHSAPLRIRVIADGEDRGWVEAPGTLRTSTGTTRIDLDPGRVTARVLRLEFPEVRERLVLGWSTGEPEVMPLGIVSVDTDAGLPRATFDPGTSTPGQDADGACRSDLLWIDGAPLPLRILGHPEDARAREALTVEPCSPPLELSAGVHRIRAAAGRDTGVDLDRLVLALEIGASGADEAAGAADTRALPQVTVTVAGRTDMALEIGAGDRPVWLVLGQSLNDGWHLTGPDGDDLGPPSLVDGYANGWLVEPSPDGPTTFTLEWEPQRMVRRALLASLLAALACLAVAVRGRPGGPRPSDTVAPVDPRGRHRLLGPRDSGLRGSILVGVAAGAFALANLPTWPVAAPLVGLVAGLSVAGRIPHRTDAMLGALTMTTAAGLIAIEQVRFRHPRDFVWPQFFDHLHVVGVLAVVLLAAAAIREAVERRGHSGPSTPGGAGS